MFYFVLSNEIPDGYLQKFCIRWKYLLNYFFRSNFNALILKQACLFLLTHSSFGYFIFIEPGLQETFDPASFDLYLNWKCFFCSCVSCFFNFLFRTDVKEIFWLFSMLNFSVLPFSFICLINDLDIFRILDILRGYFFKFYDMTFWYIKCLFLLPKHELFIFFKEVFYENFLWEISVKRTHRFPTI